MPSHSAPNGADHAIAVLERTVEALRQADARAQEAERERDEARMEVAALKMAADAAEADAKTARAEAQDLAQALAELRADVIARRAASLPRRLWGALRRQCCNAVCPLRARGRKRPALGGWPVYPEHTA